LSAYQRSLLALRLEESYRAKAKENLGGDRKSESFKSSLEISPNLIEPINTRVEIAKVAGVSDNTIARVKRIEERGSDEQKAALAANAKSGSTPKSTPAMAVKQSGKRSI
jgi:uncharacterized protein YerC